MCIYFFKEAEPFVPFGKAMRRGFVPLELGGIKKIPVELDLARLKKSRVLKLRDKILSYDGLRFGSKELCSLMPDCFQESDGKKIFYAYLPDFVQLTAKRLSADFNVRTVLYDSDLDLAEKMLECFPVLALAGENSMNVSGELYKKTGAAIPVTTGTSEGDIAVYAASPHDDNCFLRIGYDMSPEVGGLGVSSMHLCAGGIARRLSSLFGRALTAGEAQLLSENTEISSFNICD